MQIHKKYHSSLIMILHAWSQWNFAFAMTIVCSDWMYPEHNSNKKLILLHELHLTELI